MLLVQDLDLLAQMRLEDAEALEGLGRSPGAQYLCGYAAELGLKAAICRTLGWPGYPDENKEFDRLRSFKTHDLDLLLHLSGKEVKVLATKRAEWDLVNLWRSTWRYKTSPQHPQSTQAMIVAVRVILKELT